MNDLLKFELDAHGGLERWSNITTLATDLSVRSQFWGLTVAVSLSLRSLYDSWCFKESRVSWLATHAVRVQAS